MNAFLTDTLNSILNLKSLPDQLVISNNSSTDNSSIEIDKFASIYKGNFKNNSANSVNPLYMFKPWV